MSEPEVLPDVLAPHLKVVFCGTAAGRVSAATQSYYAHPQNQFWRTLAAVSLTPRQLQPAEYLQLLEYGIGLTDLAKHHAGMDSDIPDHGFDPAAFQAKMLQYGPQVVAFTSKRTGHVYFKRPVSYGLQPERIGAVRLFIVPSPSPAARSSWDIGHWQALAELVHTP
jgi:TDG/mug DNA glycosylase family protein